MANVLDAVGAFGLSAIAGILAAAPAAIDRLRGVVDQVSPRIRARQAETMRKAVFISRLQRMENRIPVRHHHSNTSVLRIWTPRLRERNVARLRIVEVVQASIDKRAFAAHPADLQRVVGGDLARDLQVPVLDVCIAPLAVFRQRNYVEDRIVGIEFARNRILNRCDRIQSGIGDGQAAAGRRVELQDVDVVELRRCVEDAVASAQRPSYR